MAAISLVQMTHWQCLGQMPYCSIKVSNDIAE